MAGHIKVDVEKFELHYFSTRIDSKILEEFQKKCKQRNLQMCTVIETFARQYANNRYVLSEGNILKWDGNTGDVSKLNAPINKEIFDKFKYKVKIDGFSLKCIISAFIEDYVKNDLILEFTQN